MRPDLTSTPMLTTWFWILLGPVDAALGVVPRPWPDCGRAGAARRRSVAAPAPHQHPLGLGFSAIVDEAVPPSGTKP
jgi:hypothetical protein